MGSPQLATVKGVEVFAAGEWRGKVYTVKDLDDMVRNFVRFKGQVDPPAGIGHEEEQPLVDGVPGVQLDENTGTPAVGWISRLWRKGLKLYANIVRMPALIAKLINQRAYTKVSAEVYDEAPEGIAAVGNMLRRVVFLGGELPHIKTLADVPLAEFSETTQVRHPPVILNLIRASCRPKAGSYEVFFEVKKMDRKALEDKLRELGWSDDAIKLIAPVKDEDLNTLVMELITADETEDANEPPPAAAPAKPGMADAVPRDQMIAELVAMGEDEAGLQAMSDEELQALYDQKKGAAMSDETDTDTAVVRPSAKRQPSQVTLKYAERRTQQLLTRQNALDRSIRQREAEEKRARVHAFCERMQREGKILPAEMDRTAGKPTLYDRLLRADAVVLRKFSEGGKTVQKSELDLQLEEIEARPVLARYTEKVPSAQDDRRFKTLDDSIKKAADARKERLQNRQARQRA